MNRHLPDEVLWSVHEGEGTSAEQAHLENCAACRARYEQLAHDLNVLRQVLREAPPPSMPLRSRRALQIRWAPAIAVMAATLLLAWGQEWLRVLTLPVSPLEARKNEETVRFLTKEIPLALFSTAEPNPGKLPAHATNLAYLQAALDGGWPSEPCDPSRTTKCEPDLFSLLLEEQGH
jgi:hypothetical protein